MQVHTAWPYEQSLIALLILVKFMIGSVAGGEKLFIYFSSSFSVLSVLSW